METQIQPRAAEGPSSEAESVDAAWRGIGLCRRGDWQRGMYWLSKAAGSCAHSGALPAVFFAYLGFGLARYQGKHSQGLMLCRRAVELERYQGDSYLFLARTHFLIGDRRSAWSVVERGLEIDAGNTDLLGLRRELGQRRAPVLPFLARSHPLNRALGRVRHRFLATRRARDF